MSWAFLAEVCFACVMTEVASLSPPPAASVLPASAPRADAGRSVLDLASLTPSAERVELEALLQQGFATLRFPAALEARYQADKAVERFSLLRRGALWTLLLFNALLLPDWLMVPDQFDTALRLRVLVYSPLILVGLFFIKDVSGPVREWAMVPLSMVAGSITVILSLSSTDTLAPPYLICLAPILMFNGSILRTRFWIALLIDVLLIAMFLGAVAALPNPPMAIMIPMALAILATAVFTLYGVYWLEHEERVNWVMQQREALLQAQLADANGHLNRLARFDMLTDVSNRRHFDEFLAHVWSRAQHDGTEVALLMIDVDHFKAYNDHYGHLAGDACLKDVAGALTRHLRRPGDMVARVGGEEFAVVLPQANVMQAQATAERVRAGVALAARPHAASPEAEPRVTVSIGVACLLPAEAGSSLARLMAAADAALYEAKSAGRNRVAVSGLPTTPSAVPGAA